MSTVLMKGKVFADHAHKLVYPVYAEVKYDEIRLHVAFNGGDVQFLSYAGKPLHNLDYWKVAFFQYMNRWGVENLDMGVLVNDNFNDSYRWVRSSKGVPSGLDHSMVKFMLFDLPDQTVVPWETRAGLRLQEYIKMTQDFSLPAYLPSSYFIESPELLDALFLQVREQGHEGLMVKTIDHLYRQGARIDGWLKLKPENEADGQLVEVHRAVSIEGVPLDRVGSVTLRLEDGSYATPAGIAHKLGADMWQNPTKYIGTWWQFKYMERDRAGGYRHPSLVRQREDKV